MLLAGDAECPLRHADRRANFRQIQRLVGVRFQEFFKPRDDCIVAATASGHSRGLALYQAPDHQMDQFLLQGPNHLGQCENMGSSFGDLPHHLMKLQ